MKLRMRPLLSLRFAPRWRHPDRLSAQMPSPIPPSITTPNKVESRIGPLFFKDGMPSKETLAKVYDNLDFTHAFEAFVNTMQGVNAEAIRKGFLDIGVKDNETAGVLQADGCEVAVPYRERGHRLFRRRHSTSARVRWCSKRRRRRSAPSTTRGGAGSSISALPAPTGAKAASICFCLPVTTVPVPEGGFYVSRVRTSRVLVLGRMFMEKDDPQPAVDLIRKFTKIYPYEAGGVGTSIAEFLGGNTRLGRVTPPPPTVFHEGSGKVMNTIPPNDFSYYEMLNEVVQREPATSLDPELMGPLAAIGIVKGKPFAPDARMKKILTEALAVANATSRSLLLNPRDGGLVLLPGLGLVEFPVRQRLGVRDADPDDHARRRQAFPAHRLPHARRAVGVLLRRHRHHARRWRCACPASARNTSSRCWIRARNISTARRPTR